ncbi:hypothetical protein [Streptomyces sp. B1I3]|uniref:hypothetical protein n=1 Tax=Streptomyces sp. B1I3 TaxID=3042264 RepID=UPI00278B616A|nr:hypothetical protein [Streptomyces sp. B1I3]MDQ0793622.1 hypothetical protein [Streptomyces sp. B1I3]
MFRRRESVPFSFVAEADRFRSNVTPPPRERASVSQLAGRSLVGLTLIAGFAGALLFGVPALDTGSAPSHGQTSEASQHR